MTSRQSPYRAPPVADSPSTVGAAELAKKTGISQVGESSHELRALHGLRFLAAFCILFSHACSWLANFKDTRTDFRLRRVFHRIRHAAVLRPERLRHPLQLQPAVLDHAAALGDLRISRRAFCPLYPLFICFFLVGLAVDGVLQWYYEHKLNLLLVMAHYLTLTQSWVYIALFGDRLLLDGPFGLSWSLSTEFFFYVTYIVLVLHVARMRSIAGLLVTAGAMSVLVLATFAYAAPPRRDRRICRAIHECQYQRSRPHGLLVVLLLFAVWAGVRIHPGLSDARKSTRFFRRTRCRRARRVGDVSFSTLRLSFSSPSRLSYLFRPFGPERCKIRGRFSS